MSFVFNKHNPKSYVVRGDVIENLKSRQEFISKFIYFNSSLNLYRINFSSVISITNYNNII